MFIFEHSWRVFYWVDVLKIRNKRALKKHTTLLQLFNTFMIYGYPPPQFQCQELSFHCKVWKESWSEYMTYNIRSCHMSLLRREDALEQPAKVLVKCWILLRRDQNYFLFVKKKNVIKFCASIFFK